MMLIAKSTGNVTDIDPAQVIFNNAVPDEVKSAGACDIGRWSSPRPA